MINAIVLLITKHVFVFLIAKCFILLSIINFVNMLNLDTSVPVIKVGKPTSYFGYSVAQHLRIINERTNRTEHLMLIGAPQDNRRYAGSSLQSDRKRPGEVYYCPVSSNEDDCKLAKIQRYDAMPNEERRNQWMGVTVASQRGGRGYGFACAHMNKRTGLGYRWANGLCVSLDSNMEEERVYSPCSGKSTDRGHNEYGFCQAGYSADVSKDGDLLIGAPGPFNWRGAIYKNILHSSGLLTFPKWYSSRAEDPPQDSDITPPPVKYYSFLGASTKITNITRGKKTYVAGAPRSENTGQVLMFTYRKNNEFLEVDEQHILSGEQFGSQFGYSLAVGDFNADGYEDLAVGAPFYFKNGIGGTVYVYMNGPKGITSSTVPIKIRSPKMSRKQCKLMECEHSRFGFSLENIGDADKDGYTDLAVSSPYEDNERGSIYIFRGHKNGVSTTHSQRISPDDLSSVYPLQTLGHSLSGGEDMDDDGYPDVLVGAYRSHRTLLLRGRPVVNVEVAMWNWPTMIDPNATSCEKDGSKNKCFDVRVSMKIVDAPYVNKFTEDIVIDYTLEAEKYTGKKISRVYFKDAERTSGHMIQRAIRLNPRNIGDQEHKYHLLYVTRYNKDFLSPVYFRLTYNLREKSPPVMVPGDPLPDLSNHPVLGATKRQMEYIVDFLKNCGSDNVCHSNLIMDAKFKLYQDKRGLYHYNFGKKKEIILEITVKNRGEDAHGASFSLDLPQTISYIGVTGSYIDVYGKREKYNCNPQDQSVSCRLGNPLLAGAKAVLTIRLNPEKVPPIVDRLQVLLYVNTTSEELNMKNNEKVLTIQVNVEKDLEVKGNSDPSLVVYTGTPRGETAYFYKEQIGPSVIHTYSITNVGDGVIPRSRVYIDWPYEITNEFDHGKHLLYILEPPIVKTNNAQCTYRRRYVNPLDLEKMPKQRQSKNPKEPQDTRDKRRTTAKKDDKEKGKRKNKEKDEAKPTSTISDIFTLGKPTEIITLNCENDTAKCATIQCDIGTLAAGDRMRVQIKARLWNSTFVEEYANVNQVRIYSRARVVIDPSLNIKQTSYDNDVYHVQTIAFPGTETSTAYSLPFWIIIVAIIGGLLLLLAISAIMYRCGFFQRAYAEEIRQFKAKLHKRKLKER